MPSAGILWGLSYGYVAYGNVGWIAAVFHGLKAAVLAVVVAAVLRIGKKALKNRVMWGIAAVAFGAIFVGHVPFPVIVVGALVVGWVGGWKWENIFNVLKGHGASGGGKKNAVRMRAVIDDDDAGEGHVAPSWGRAAKVLGGCGVLWAAPVVAVGLWLGWDSVFVREGIFFSQAAMVTFGGAYAVLPYVAQQAVENYGWLTGPQMLDGLGLAETTPGPLIMVLQFVGFLGAWHQPGGLTPLGAATLGAAITTWVTFVPCFLWIFLGAPHIEQLRKNVRLTCALSAVTAAVVGVVLNLAVWFGWHVVRPTGDAANAAGVVGGTDWFVVAVGVGAFVAMQRWKMGVIPVVLASGVLGLAWAWVG